MNLIEIKGLSKSFGNLSVLENVSLSVAAGERIAIIGGSGCGKSVFLRSIELLEQPDAGQIFIDGEEITAKGAEVDRIRRKMGMVYQKFHLFQHMNVMDNLCLAPVKLLGMPRKEAEEKAMSLLKQVGLAARSDSFPAVLSGGQQQRIAICRSLMMEPKILLFDEPTSALDPTMVGEVLAVIRMLAKRSLTMLIVTHEMNFARDVADRVLFFADKGICEEGTPEEIFDHPKKEKTIAFIHKIKYFSFEIREPDFDLMELQGGIQIFGEKYGMSSREIYHLQLCCEEVIYEMLANCYEDPNQVHMGLDISFSESEGTLLVSYFCTGKAYNPLEQEEPGLGITVLKKVAGKLSYRYEDGLNRIFVEV